MKTLIFLVSALAISSQVSHGQQFYYVQSGYGSNGGVGGYQQAVSYGSAGGYGGYGSNGGHGGYAQAAYYAPPAHYYAGRVGFGLNFGW